MKRKLFVLLLAGTGLVGVPARAAADATLFAGFSPTPQNRSARGFAIGFNILIVGFEFDYANTREDPAHAAPGLKTGMFNALVMTPTSGFQLYGTVGGGVFREYVVGTTETNFGSNIGGGAKIRLVGPLRLRLDYRVFNLHGSARYKNPQRFYAGVNLAF